MKVFGKLKDGHTTILLTGINDFSDLFYKSAISIYFPVIFNIRNDTNEIPRMYSKPNINDNLNKQFKNSLEVFEVINSSIDSPIKAINGEDPFDFISKLGSEFIEIRNPHGSFTRKFNTINKTPLYLMPLYKENLTNFTVEYENNLTFKTDLFIIGNQNIFPKHNTTPI